MTDLAVGLAAMLLLSAGIGALAWRLTKDAKRETLTRAALGTVLLLVIYLRWLHDSAVLAWLIPTPAVLVLGRWHLLFAVVLAVLAWRRMNAPHWRKALVSGLLLIVAGYGAYWDLLAPSAVVRVEVENTGVTIQSTPSSCSAAAAVTFLRAHGIETTEREMARLCFTTTRGTSFHGLVRGLRIKTRGTGWTVQPFHASSIGGLRKRTRSRPAMIWVRLDSGSNVDPRYERDWGWVPGLSHAVVLFRFDGDRAEMGDPSVGREFWNVKGLKDLWHGEGIRLRKDDS